MTKTRSSYYNGDQAHCKDAGCAESTFSIKRSSSSDPGYNLIAPIQYDNKQAFDDSYGR